MPREYRHMEEYEEEIIRLYEEGTTLREIGEKFGFSYKQMRNFKTRYGPSKDCVVTEEDKLADLRYKLARKDARIKQLEMENELMRDFLSLTGRK